eukprot:6200308-Pleurochrysis_carterae.AAC.2
MNLLLVVNSPVLFCGPRPFSLLLTLVHAARCAGSRGEGLHVAVKWGESWAQRRSSYTARIIVQFVDDSRSFAEIATEAARLNRSEWRALRVGFLRAAASLRALIVSHSSPSTAQSPVHSSRAQP